jgi:predicted HicB family RNase H-like nuclease
MSATRKPLTFDLDRSPLTPAEQAAATKETRKQVGARVTAATYRQLKARAAMQGDKVQDLVERAITEFLANHPE